MSSTRRTVGRPEIERFFREVDAVLAAPSSVILFGGSVADEAARTEPRLG